MPEPLGLEPVPNPGFDDERVTAGGGGEGGDAAPLTRALVTDHE